MFYESVPEKDSKVTVPSSAMVVSELLPGVASQETSARSKSKSSQKLSMAGNLMVSLEITDCVSLN